MNLEEIISKFDNARRERDGFKVRCPCHSDSKNSLSINEGRGGAILLNCFAGCETKNILDAVGLDFKDISPRENGSRSHQHHDDTIARYVYTDEAGRALFRVCRTRSKRFFQERFEAGKFIPGMQNCRRVLYKLPELVGSEIVYIVEGEKDVERLTSLGLVATTNVGGAGKWTAAYSEILKGKDVVIFPDNDGPGAAHAVMIAKSLLGLAASVKIVSLPELPPKGDISDYLKSHTKEDLLVLVAMADPFTGADTKGQHNLWPELLSAKDILQKPEGFNAVDLARLLAYRQSRNVREALPAFLSPVCNDN